jgi:hypothetical protein
MRGFQASLGLAGAWALLGVPAGELSGQLVEAGDLDPQLALLPERLAGAPRTRWAALVQAALVTALARHDLPGPRAEIGRSLAQLTRGHHVQAVADEVGFSRRPSAGCRPSNSSGSPASSEPTGWYVPGVRWPP